MFDDQTKSLKSPATLSRRALGIGATAMGLSFLSRALLADSTIDLRLPGGGGERPTTETFPQKGKMILQRTRPPLLETPFEVFDQGLLTPNDQFYVRWHWANIPNKVDADAFRLNVRGEVNSTLSLSLRDLLLLPAVDLVAVNQCSGNSRGYFVTACPWSAMGQWGNEQCAHGRACVLKDVLDRAGVKAGAIAVRFNGLDEQVIPEAPDFMKSLDVDHARDGEVMIAYAMNGEQLPLLNGFPLRLIVPGWYSTYWVKMLNDIEVLDKPDDNFWMAKAYLIPDTPFASVKPGQTGVKMVPINRMIPRSFFTNLKSGTQVPAAAPLTLRGIAFGGDAAVSNVDISVDRGVTWEATELGKDETKYGLRRWQLSFTPRRGDQDLMVRCTNHKGDQQPMEANWNPSGFMRNVVETISLSAV